MGDRVVGYSSLNPTRHPPQPLFGHRFTISSGHRVVTPSISPKPSEIANLSLQGKNIVPPPVASERRIHSNACIPTPKQLPSTDYTVYQCMFPFSDRLATGWLFSRPIRQTFLLRRLRFRQHVTRRPKTRTTPRATSALSGFHRTALIAHLHFAFDFAGVFWPRVAE